MLLTLVYGYDVMFLLNNMLSSPICDFPLTQVFLNVF